MSPAPTTRRRFLRWAGAACVAGPAATLAGTLGGCALFDESVDVLTPGGYDESAADDPRIARFRPAVERITLEVASVERPADDPVLWRAVWDPVSEVGAVDADRAEALREAGFRVGVISSEPPEALRALLDTHDEVGVPLPDTRRRAAVLQRVPLPAGGTAALQTGARAPELTVAGPPTAGVDGETTPGRTETFHTAGGVVRVRCRTPQAGWASFEFIPEVHHGPVGRRVRADSAGWTSTTGQKVRSWPDRAFEVTLTIGDGVVLGLREDADPDSLAAALLTHEAEGHRVERLLLVRLADVRRAELEPAR